MALMCKHDHTLFIVNMTTAGEKQHYAIVLLQALLSELSDWWRLGVLYDIACVLEQSCIQWNYFGSAIHRLQFAVSIFHAYGHSYECQVHYHLRKQAGCGLFDGEGCKRLWSQLKSMISILRVSGVRLQSKWCIDKS
jgi:hypothetical protein